MRKLLKHFICPLLLLFTMLLSGCDTLTEVGVDYLSELLTETAENEQSLLRNITPGQPPGKRNLLLMIPKPPSLPSLFQRMGPIRPKMTLPFIFTLITIYLITLLPKKKLRLWDGPQKKAIFGMWLLE